MYQIYKTICCHVCFPENGCYEFFFINAKNLGSWNGLAMGLESWDIFAGGFVLIYGWNAYFVLELSPQKKFDPWIIFFDNISP